MIKKGEAPILAGVLYAGIVITGVTLILISLKPYLEYKKAEMEVDTSFLCLSDLTSSMYDVFYAVPGSSKQVKCSIRRGVLSVENNSFVWDVSVPVSYDRTKFKDWSVMQNLSAYELNGYYILYNNYLKLNISAIGSAESFVFYNLSQAFNELINVHYDVSISSDDLRFFIDNESCEVGVGYTYIKDNSSLGMHIEPSECMPYDILFIVDHENQDFVRLFVSF